MKKYWPLFLFSFAFFSCSEFIEPDLKNQNMIIIAPQDSLHTYDLSITFWWNPMQGADHYNLQIASPNFYNPATLLLDTNVTGESYSFFLSPGQYQWRVRGENSASQSDYVYRTIFIDSTQNISSMSVWLNSPFDNDTSNNLNKQFIWRSLYAAEDYLFQLYSSSTNALIYSNILTDTTYSASMPDQGGYYWKVRGQNTFSNTAFSQFNFFVDTVSPDQAQLLLPLDGAILPDSSITFSWSRTPDQLGSSEWDSIFIVYADPPQNYVIRERSTNMSFSDSLGTGQYLWWVNSYDKAGNQGYSSSAYSLDIQ